MLQVKNIPRTMAASLKTLFFIMFCLLSASVIIGDLHFVDQLKMLNVPMLQFLGSVRSTVDDVRLVIPTMSNFKGKFIDFRLSNALCDCVDLLNISLDELNWTLSAAQNIDGKENNSPENLSADMRAWLTGVLINQDTCLEGFDDTSTTIKILVANFLDHIIKSVQDILSMVPLSLDPVFKGDLSRGAGGGGGGGSGGGGGGSDRKKVKTNEKFPRWLKPNDRKLLRAADGTMADMVVAADGTGNFTCIMDAISAVPEYSTRRYVIYVKRGVYHEYVEVSNNKSNIMMIGDGMDVTIISGNRNYADGWTTYSSATFGVSGQGFIARDMTFENTAGPHKLQAVAFRSNSECSVVYRCAIRGYQDTLFSHSLRQFYRECQITGTVDFIFGRGTVVFQNCQLLAREGLPGQQNTVTAHGRENSTDSSGYIIQYCNISAESNVKNPTYLGRPWKKCSRTIIMESYISDAIRPEGWLEWNGNLHLDTLFYAEYMNHGPGADLGGRVKWPGYHIINDSAQVKQFTVAQFISGNTWLPSTGVKYTDDLAI